MAKVVKGSSSQPKATAAKLKSDDKFRIFAEMTASLIFILQNKRIKYANPALERLTGYTSQELERMDYEELFAAEKNTSLVDWVSQAQMGNITTPRGEFRVIAKDGDEVWVDLVVTSINYEGKPSLFGTAFDITERKRAEILQDAVYLIAQAADRSKRLDDLFPAVHAIISEVMPAENFYIALKDVDSDLILFPYYVDEYDKRVLPQKPRKGLTEYVINTGKSLLCTKEVDEQLGRLGDVELVGTPSSIWLGVPLIVDGNVIGAMAVQDYHNSTAFGVREQRIMEFVSSQVAMVITRKRAEEALRENDRRLQRRADELAVLYETTREMSSQRDTQTLLQTVVDRAAFLLNAAGGAIFLCDNDNSELELKVAYGYQGFVGTKVSVEEGLVGQVAQMLQPMVVEDYRLWENRSPKYDAVPITAKMAAPMLYGGDLVGVLVVYEVDTGTPIRRFTKSEIEQMTFFAGSAAIAVRNMRLFDETKQRLVELELLYQASLSSVQIHSLHAVAQKIVDALEHLLNWRGSIWLVEDKRPVLVAIGAMGLTGEPLKEVIDRSNQTIYSFDTGIIGWVCKNGRSLRTGNAKNNPHYIERWAGINSELCVPLKIGGKTIGCINVDSTSRDAFGEHDERLLNTLANQAAVGIENARLFEETQKRAIRQVALNAIISASARVGTSLDEILNIALEQTLKALNLDMGAIWISWSPRSIQRIVSRGSPPSINAMMANAVVSGDISLARTLVVNDWHNAKHGFASMFLAIGINSTIVVPLLSNDKHIGGLSVSSSVVQNWTIEEIALVEAIGREVGLAAERAKLFEETTNRINELEAVNKVSTSMRQAQSLEGMLPLLVDETLKALDTGTGGIWLYDLKKEKLVQMIGRGWCLKAAQLELDRGEELLGSVLTTGDVYYSSDVATDPQASIEFRRIAPSGWSGICVPIRTEQVTIGVFMVFSLSPREFSGEEGRLLVTVTEMAGNAITRMRLNEQTLQHAAELETRVAARTAELQEALQKAQAADRLKSEFIANVNHELRTPLTNLILYYQMLRSQPAVKTEERLDVIGRELQRLRGLIEELLSLSRLDLGQVTFHITRCDLNGLIQTLVNDRQALAGAHNLTLQTELQANLEPVMLDEPTMIQAISNLLTNALNYTPEGGRVLVRTMTAATADEIGTEVGVSVEDDGLGISTEDLPHLFERFYRGGTGQKSGAPGTGLGLAIVKQVVEGHHGRIVVGKGIDGKGAKFTIWLPVKQIHGTR
jgi:PAS domain S-box-containing protein